MRLVAKAPRARALAAWVAGGLIGLAAPAALAADAAVKPAPRWGAIATVDGLYGYSFNHASRSAAENAARAQCQRRAGRSGSGCEVRIAFDRACGAMAAGNFTEWGVASAPTLDAARKEAVAQCNAHLPTEPCKVMVSVCSVGGD